MTKQLPHVLTYNALIFIFFFLVLALTGQAFGAKSVSTEEWDITADRVIQFDNPPSIVAEGNIELVKKKVLPPKPKVKKEQTTDWSVLLGEEATPTEVTPEDLPASTEVEYKTEITIKADWLRYDTTLGTIKARGNVSVESDGELLMADQAVVNVEQQTGSFTKATIIRDEYDMHLEGEVIEKTGYKTYRIENGWVVTCKLKKDETAPWSIAAGNAVIEQDGYATLNHARFRINDVPVFYLPWLMLPVKTTRQSGILFPEFSSSKNNGLGINLPIFWNISDSTDLTFYTEYMENRGFMPSLEFRYYQNSKDKGAFMGTYLYDDLSDPSETDYYRDTGYTHDNQERYWVRGKIDQDFGSGWTSRLDLDLVSDRDYLTEFNSGMTGFKDSNDNFLDTFGRGFENKTDDQRNNSFSIQNSWGPTSLTAQLLTINDVRANKTSPTPLWRLPDVEYDGALPIGSGGNLVLNWDADYVFFYREDGIGGHRIDLHPRLSAPIPLGSYLESRAEVGVRDTIYSVQEFGDGQWSNDSEQNRLLYDIHAEVGTTLLRDFAVNGNGYDAFRHQIRPYVEYDFIPDEDQTDLPYFSSIDRISQSNKITYGFDNFFDLLDGGSKSREYGSLKIKQSYSLLDDDSDEPLSDINAKLKWKPSKSASLTYKTDLDMYGDGFVRHNLEFAYLNGRGDKFGMEYVFDDTTDTEQINGAVKAMLIPKWYLDLDIKHSISEDETNEADLAITYRAPCWSVSFGSEYTPNDTVFMIMFNLANIGSPFGVDL